MAFDARTNAMTYSMQMTNALGISLDMQLQGAAVLHLGKFIQNSVESCIRFKQRNRREVSKSNRRFVQPSADILIIAEQAPCVFEGNLEALLILLRQMRPLRYIASCVIPEINYRRFDLSGYRQRRLIALCHLSSTVCR